MVNKERQKHIIDATGQPLGRLASHIAHLLIGKHKPAYSPNIDIGDFVEVHFISKVTLTGKKMDQKIRRHHSGYPGGLKEIPIKTIFANKPEQILIDAVSRMLPKNSHRPTRLKRLICK
ncbi:50S ribosomal protein L13 [Candidatus Uhrbacteria bacterium CG_4_9_14_3_um_filter_36_7]|uniref:Large ribosomal subunit protein uL13 n=1 Tax=Candidatus Uhrbacteria bacterium CG_4_9_14_3_um_filter_36_7 TaxID=1975033 RepID=A0A2M7XI63_9BACT|nr:MAG: 50S ribosomal protein L13 [Candidatus Uhrbacteria bacterium CG_4_9_14_3_um_filter_36_7]